MTTSGTAADAISGTQIRQRSSGWTWSGWVNVVVAAVLMLGTLPGRTQGLGLITEPMLADLRIDRVAYATINLWATLIGAIICLPIGRVFDRVGLRGTTVVLMLLLGGVVWVMSGLTGGPAALFVLVLGTRAIGQSALSVSSLTAVGKAFDRQIGVAMGVFSVLLTVFFAAAFTAVGTSVRVSGWRTAWAQVAIGMFVLAPTALLLRARAGEQAGDDADESGRSLSLAEALRTPAFWIFGGATALFGLVSSGLGLFNEAVLAERGFPQEVYVQFLAGTAVIGLVGQMACGWMTLRWSLQRLLALSMTIYAAALAAIPIIDTLTELWVLAVLYGLAGGMITVIFFAVWRRAFGSEHLGRIQGAAQMLTVLASAIGPLIFAQSASLTGSYFPALWILAPCVLLLGAASVRIVLPRFSPL